MDQLKAAVEDEGVSCIKLAPRVYTLSSELEFAQRTVALVGPYGGDTGGGAGDGGGGAVLDGQGPTRLIKVEGVRRTGLVDLTVVPSDVRFQRDK